MSKKTTVAKTTVAETAVVETAVAEIDDVKASFKSFDIMIKYFIDKIEDIQRVTLGTCWEIGHEANLIKKASVYGEKTVDNFVTSLDTPGMDIKRIYRYAQFAKEYSREDFDAVLAKKHVGWGAINKLISVKNKEDRAGFEDKLDKGDIKPSELDKHISLYMNELENEDTEEVTPPGTPGSGGRRSFAKHFKKGANAAEILVGVIPLAMKDLTDLSEIANDSDKYDKVLDTIYVFREMAEELTPLLNKFQEEAGKLA